MGSKIAAAVMAAILIVSSGAGVFVWASTKSNNSANTEQTETVSNIATVNTGEPQRLTNETAAAQNGSTLNTEQSEAGINDQTDAVLSADGIDSGILHILKIVDRTDDSEVSQREVLGDEYSSSYIQFRPDMTYHLILGYKDKSGTYTCDESNDTIIITYQDGSNDSCSFATDDQGGINSVIVPYGDYDIYFA